MDWIGSILPSLLLPKRNIFALLLYFHPLLSPNMWAILLKLSGCVFLIKVHLCTWTRIKMYVSYLNETKNAFYSFNSVCHCPKLIKCGQHHPYHHYFSTYYKIFNYYYRLLPKILPENTYTLYTNHCI